MNWGNCFLKIMLEEIMNDEMNERMINLVLISRISVSNDEIKQVDKSPKKYVRARIMNFEDGWENDCMVKIVCNNGPREAL